MRQLWRPVPHIARIVFGQDIVVVSAVAAAVVDTDIFVDVNIDIATHNVTVVLFAVAVSLFVMAVSP